MTTPRPRLPRLGLFAACCAASWALACASTPQSTQRPVPARATAPVAKSAPQVTSTSAAPPAPASADMAPATWRDFDDLPSGAIRRLGTNRFASNTAGVAIGDDGTMWISDGDLGIIAIRLDGRYRVYDPKGCPSTHDQFRLFAGGIRALCGHTIRTIGETTVSTVTLPRSSECVWSPNGSLAACIEYLETTHKGNCDVCTASDKRLIVAHLDGGIVWSLLGNFDDVQQLRASDAGEVLVQTGKTLAVASDGKMKWSKPLDSAQFDSSAITSNQQEAIGYDGQKWQWVRVRLSDGREMHRSPVQKVSLRREIVPLPNKDLIYVALSTENDQPKPINAVVNFNTGAIVHQWAAPPIEWSNAVSPNGQFVASVGLGHLMRVRLDAPSILPEVSPVVEVPQDMTISPDNRVLAVFGNGQYDQHLTMYDTQTGAQRSRVLAPRFAERLAFTEDGTKVAISSKFGDYSLVDTASGKNLCKSENVAGAELVWRGNKLLSVYPGDNGDDCDEITPASITLVDDQCHVVKRYEVHGLIEVLERRPDTWIFSAAKWKTACGDNYELLPARQWSVDLRSGAKVDVGAYKRVEAKETDDEDGMEPPTSEYGMQILARSHIALDGKTKVVLQTWATDTNVQTSTLSCVDSAKGNVLVRYKLPPSAQPIINIAAHGEWMAVTDRTSVLLYPCRNKEF